MKPATIHKLAEDAKLAAARLEGVAAILTAWAEEVPKKPAWEAYNTAGKRYGIDHHKVKMILAAFFRAALDEK